MLESSKDISMEMFYRETGWLPDQGSLSGFGYIDDHFYTRHPVEAPVDIVDRDKPEKPKNDDAFSWSPPEEGAPPQTRDQRGLEERDGWA